MAVDLPEDDFIEKIERMKREELYKFPVLCISCEREFVNKESIVHSLDCDKTIRHIIPLALIEHLRKIHKKEQQKREN